MGSIPLHYPGQPVGLRCLPCTLAGGSPLPRLWPRPHWRASTPTRLSTISRAPTTSLSYPTRSRRVTSPSSTSGYAPFATVLLGTLSKAYRPLLFLNEDGPSRSVFSPRACCTLLASRSSW